MQTHEMLAQEPWCFHPAWIADLTDWQIEHLYARPAIERAKRLETQHTGDEPMQKNHNPTDPPEPGTPEFKEWVIAQFMTMGMSRQVAESQYDEQARQG